MKAKRLAVLGLGFWLGLAHGCGSSENHSPSRGPAGTAGAAAGRAGRAGAGNVAGRGGAAGGFATGGLGGMTAGSGGGDTAGLSGTSGVGGACLTAVPSHDLGDSCGSAEYATVATTCSFEDTCQDLNCGAPWSDFDANGCRRATCTSSDTCGTGERCVPSVLYQAACNPSTYERCSVESCGHCACSTSADCNIVGFCFAVADYPASGDCNVDPSDCAGAANRLAYLEIDTSFTGDAAAAINACAQRLHDMLEVCAGGMGVAGGSGAAGAAGAGGESGAAAGGEAGRGTR